MFYLPLGKISVASLPSEVVTQDELLSAIAGLEYSGGILPSTVPEGGFYLFDDFISSVSGYGWVLRNQNGGSVSAIAGEISRPGIIRVATGTNSNGIGMISSLINAFYLGGGAINFQSDVRVTNLSVSGEEVRLSAGFMDNVNDIAVNGAIFTHDISVDPNNWVCRTSIGSAANQITTVVTDVPVTVNAWTRFRIEINVLASQVDFYINQALKASITTNIPAGNGKQLGVGYQAKKVSGVGFKGIDVDYNLTYQAFATPRAV